MERDAPSLPLLPPILPKATPMRESIQHAKTYITQAIIAGKELNIGHGNGPLWHFPDTVAQMCTFVRLYHKKYVTLHPQLKIN